MFVPVAPLFSVNLMCMCTRTSGDAVFFGVFQKWSHSHVFDKPIPQEVLDFFVRLEEYEPLLARVICSAFVSCLEKKRLFLEVLNFCPQKSVRILVCKVSFAVQFAFTVASFLNYSFLISHFAFCHHGGMLQDLCLLHLTILSLRVSAFVTMCMMFHLEV